MLSCEDAETMLPPDGEVKRSWESILQSRQRNRVALSMRRYAAVLFGLVLLGCSSDNSVSADIDAAVGVYLLQMGFVGVYKKT